MPARRRPRSAQAHARGGERRHLADGLLEPQDLLVAHVVAEDPRRRAEGAGVHLLLRQDAVLGPRLGVRAERHERVPQRRAHVLLAHAERHPRRVAAVGHHDVEERVDRIGTPLLRDLLEGQALVPLELGVEDARHEDALGARGPVGVLRQAQEVGARPGPRGGVREARHHALGSALAHPDGQARVEAVRAGRPRVLVGAHVQALGPRPLDLPQELRHAAPGPLSRRLEVVDLRRDLRLAGDPEDLVQAGVEADRPVVALVPLVRDVAAAVAGRDPGEGDELVGRGEEARNVDERAREAEGPFLHGLRHRGLHGLELRGRRRAVLLADDQVADAPRADERPQVDRRAAALQLLEVAGQRREGRRVAVVRVRGAAGLEHARVERRDRAALAGDLGRDALGDLAGGPAVDQHAVLRLPHHVDEAGRHHQAARVDPAAGPRLRHPARPARCDRPRRRRRRGTTARRFRRRPGRRRTAGRRSAPPRREPAPAARATARARSRAAGRREWRKGASWTRIVAATSVGLTWALHPGTIGRNDSWSSTRETPRCRRWGYGVSQSRA